MKEIISTSVTTYITNTYSSTVQISMFKNTEPDELASNKLKKKKYQLNMRNYLPLICFLLTNLRHREKFLCTTTDL
jgi:hypothetical protein